MTQGMISIMPTKDDNSGLSFNIPLPSRGRDVVLCVVKRSCLNVTRI